MLAHLIRKELLEQLLSLRFAMACIICLIITLSSALVLTRDYREALADYRTNVVLHKNELEDSGDIWDDGVVIDKPLNPMQIFVRGVDPRLVVSARVTHGQQPIFEAEHEVNPVSYLFPPGDLLFFIGVVMSLLALAFGYDAVSGEKESGTLKLLMSYSAPRDLVLLAKWVGGYLALAAPFLLAVTAALVVVMVMPGVELGEQDWGALVLLIAVGLLYLAAVYGMGIFVSARTHLASTSITVLLMVWVLMILVVPNLAPYLAAEAVPLRNFMEVEEEKAAASETASEAFEQELDEFTANNPEVERWGDDGQLGRHVEPALPEAGPAADRRRGPDRGPLRQRAGRPGGRGPPPVAALPVLLLRLRRHRAGRGRTHRGPPLPRQPARVPPAPDGVRDRALQPRLGRAAHRRAPGPQRPSPLDLRARPRRRTPGRGPARRDAAGRVDRPVLHGRLPLLPSLRRQVTALRSPILAGALAWLAACGDPVERHIDTIIEGEGDLEEARLALNMAKGYAVDPLIAAFEDRSLPARARVDLAESLYRLYLREADRRIFASLVAGLEDPEPRVRAGVARAIGNLRRPEAVAPLLARFEAETDPAMKGEILSTLEFMSSEPDGDWGTRANPDLLDAAQKESFGAGLRTLVAAGPPEELRTAAMEWLEVLAEDRSEEAENLFLAADAAGAEALLRSALELAPESLNIHQKLGKLFYAMGDEERGREYLERLGMVARAPRLKARPKIDGRLDEPAWRQVRPHTEFYQCIWRLTARPAEGRSEAWVGYRADTLYIAVKGYEPSTANLAASGDGAGRRCPRRRLHGTLHRHQPRQPVLPSLHHQHPRRHPGQPPWSRPAGIVLERRHRGGYRRGRHLLGRGSGDPDGAAGGRPRRAGRGVGLQPGAGADRQRLGVRPVGADLRKRPPPRPLRGAALRLTRRERRTAVNRITLYHNPG